MKQRARAQNRLFTTVLLTAMLVGGLTGWFSGGKVAHSSGFAWAQSQAITDSQATAGLSPLLAFRTALQTIQREYVPAAPPRSGRRAAPPDNNALTYAAIAGMLRQIGDPYTEFWTPQEYRRNLEETRGDYIGIGASLDVTPNQRVLIREPVANSPAMRAGLRPGDIVVRIEGKPIAGLSLSQVVERIKGLGKRGQPLHLTIARRNSLGREQLLSKTVVRDIVYSSVVKSRLLDAKNGIGYIALELFNEQADAQFQQALTLLEKQGLRALIFDLRDNPGGLLNSAQDIASRFVDNGPVVWVQDKEQRTALEVIPARHDGKLNKRRFRVAVLVNHGSASAAEIVCGAIKDNQLGTIVGTRTFGKGLVQTIFPIGPDTAVKVTTQHYYTPRGSDLNRGRDADGREIIGGIVPDVPVELTQNDQAAMQNARRADPLNHAAADKFDPQLQTAIALLGKGT